MIPFFGEMTLTVGVAYAARVKTRIISNLVKAGVSGKRYFRIDMESHKRRLAASSLALMQPDTTRKVSPFSILAARLRLWFSINPARIDPSESLPEQRTSVPLTEYGRLNNRNLRPVVGQLRQGAVIPRGDIPCSQSLNLIFSFETDVLQSFRRKRTRYAPLVGEKSPLPARRAARQSPRHTQMSRPQVKEKVLTRVIA